MWGAAYQTVTETILQCPACPFAVPSLTGSDSSLHSWPEPSSHGPSAQMLGEVVMWGSCYVPLPLHQTQRSINTRIPMHHGTAMPCAELIGTIPKVLVICLTVSPYKHGTSCRQLHGNYSKTLIEWRIILQSDVCSTRSCCSESVANAGEGSVCVTSDVYEELGP